MTGDFEPQGWVIWITGLSGSGKTTIAKLLSQKLRSHLPNTILLDGDDLRKLLPADLGYSLRDRRECAAFYGRLSRLLAAQGQHVLVATISMFDDCRSWNRRNIRNYFEVYLRVAPETLIELNRNGIYAKARRGEVRGVVGFDLPMEEPKEPDLVIDNDGLVDPEVLANRIFQELERRL